MKKLLYSLLTLAAALTVASCQKEPVNNADPTLGGPTVNATVSLNVSGLVDTKAFANAENVKKLHIAFYSGGEMVEALSKVGANAISLTEKTYVYDNIKLGKGVAYDIICWAESENSPYALDFTAKTVTYKENVSLTANNDTYDAFYGTASLTAEDTAQKVNLTINLKRPFAQVNVLVPNDNVGSYKTFKSSMDVTVPTTMNLADGTLTGDAKKVSFAEADFKKDEATIKENHTYVAMNYVFAPAVAANYPVSFTVIPDETSTAAASLNLSTVSLKRNRRTNLVGSIFSAEVDGSITVNIIPNLENGDESESADAQDPDVTIAFSEITEPLTIAEAGQTASFTLTTNSAGVFTVSSEDESVASVSFVTGEGTATTNEYTVTATGVADGTTYIVANIASGQTKANLKGAKVKVPVKVGDGIKKQGVQSLVWKLDNNEVETCTVTYGADDNIFPTLDKTNAKGAVTYASSNTNVATVDAEGHVALVAASETPINITATAAKVEAKDSEDGLEYPAITVSYALTVNAAPVVKKDVTLTIVDKVTDLTVGQEVGFVAQIAEEGAEGTLSLPLTWASSDAAVTVSANETSSANATVKGVSEGSATITVSFAGNDAYNEASASVDVTVSEAQTEYDFTTIAELKANLTTTAASFSGKLTDAVVSFVPGTGDAVIKDATASILYHKSGHGLKQGQVFSGDITVEAVRYNNLYSDITSIGDAAFTGDETAVEPEVVTLAQLTAEGGYAAYEDAYVKVVGMTSGTTTTAKGNITATQDGTSYIVYTNVPIPINTGDVFNAEGTVTKYNTTEQLKVWGTEYLTFTTRVTTIEADNLSVPVGETVQLNYTTNNTLGAVSFTSSDSSIASVASDGKVTGGTAGTATITITIDASEGFSQGTAQITVTVLAGSLTKMDAGITIWDDDFSSSESSSTALTSLAGSKEGFGNDYKSMTTVYPMSGAIRIGKASGSGSITLPANLVAEGYSADVIITFKAEGWNGKTAKLTVSSSDATVVEGETTITSSSTMAGAAPALSTNPATYTFHVKGVTNNSTISFTTNNTCVGIDDLKLITYDSSN